MKKLLAPVGPVTTSSSVDVREPSPRKPPLEPCFSIYLDLVRFAAAMVVFIEHGHQLGLVRQLPWIIDGLAHEAVIVFFVLSGYIIEAVTDRDGGDGRQFAAARASRIYSVAVPALLLGYGTIAVTRISYEGWGGLGRSLGVAQLLTPLGCLTFQGQDWFLDRSPTGNGPYWSLFFEVWYYYLYGVFVFSRGRSRIGWFVLGLLLAGPKILLLAPCWLACWPPGSAIGCGSRSLVPWR